MLPFLSFFTSSDNASIRGSATKFGGLWLLFFMVSISLRNCATWARVPSKSFRTSSNLCIVSLIISHCFFVVSDISLIVSFIASSVSSLPRICSNMMSLLSPPPSMRPLFFLRSNPGESSSVLARTFDALASGATAFPTAGFMTRKDVLEKMRARAGLSHRERERDIYDIITMYIYIRYIYIYMIYIYIYCTYICI